MMADGVIISVCLTKFKRVGERLLTKYLYLCGHIHKPFNHLINKEMKKALFSFAILAVATAMVSCGNKSAQNTENQDSVAVAAEPEEVPVQDQKEIASDIYVIKVPEGWKARSRMVNNSCNLGLGEAPFTTAALNVEKSESLDKFKETRAKENCKALDNVTVNGREFVVYEGENQNGEPFVAAATPMGEGHFRATLYSGACQMKKDEIKAALTANLQTILENVSFK